MMRNRHIRLVFCCGVLASAICALDSNAVHGGNDAAAESAVDVQPRPVPHLRPGTRVPDGPPQGWSHLILKSKPRLEQGDVSEVPAIVARLASFQFTTFAADVAETTVDGRPWFYLNTIGVGLGTDVRGEDVIVASRTHKQQGANLGIIKATVLSQSEAQLARIVQLGRSSNVAIFDAPGYMLRGERHRPIVMRYVVLVHPHSGRLSTFAWLMDVTPSGEYVLVDGSLRLLKPNLVEDSPLHVDSGEFIAGIPTPTAFALASLPPGVACEMPDSLRRIAALRRLSGATVMHIERLLSTLAEQAGDSALAEP